MLKDLTDGRKEKRPNHFKVDQGMTWPPNHFKVDQDMTWPHDPSPWLPLQALSVFPGSEEKPVGMIP